MAPPPRLRSLPAWRRTGGAAVLLAGLGLATGCGGGHSSVNPAIALADEAQQTSVAATAAGAMASAGVNQLFSGGSFAWRPQPVGHLATDAADPLTVMLKDSGNEPPSPTVGGGTITSASPSFPTTTAGQPQVVRPSSALTYSIDTAGLPAGWYHVALATVGGSPWTIVDETGNTAKFSTGAMDLFVLDTVTADDHAGNWTHVIDSYAIVTAAIPLAGAVTIADGTIRPLSLTGLRHEHRTVARTVSGGVATRTDTVIVDGDFSALPAGTTPPSPGNGPNLSNATPPQLLSIWAMAATTPTGFHNFQWSRTANYTEVYSFAPGAATPGTGSVPFHAETVYVTKDGYTPYGPLTDFTLINAFRMVYDLNRAAQFY
jgi:hypothetical protein